jgi:PPK2 family polyphosphate:nucleotide phosphotransferase
VTPLVAEVVSTPPPALVCEDASMAKGSKGTTTSRSTKGKGKGKAGGGKGGASARAGAPAPTKVTPDGKLSGKAARKAEKKRATAAKARRDEAVEPVTWTDALRVGPGFSLADLDPRSTPGFTGDKADGKEVMAELQSRLGDLQERLFAESKGGGRRRVLLVIQGMDTSGKGGIMRHVVGAVDPQGVNITSFKAPSAQERRRPFLWRIRNALPQPGQLGVFDRSHYEDVLVVRVHDLVPPARWKARYRHITDFEKMLADEGTVIRKFFLHISKEEQAQRLRARLADPTKQWKFRKGDLAERAHWDAYQRAFEAAISRTAARHAPWIVVPADKKWHRDLVICRTIVETLEGLDLRYPAPEEDLTGIVIE